MDKRSYELTVVESAETKEEEMKKGLEALLDKSGGKLVEWKWWGVRELMYPMRKMLQASYGWAELLMSPVEVAELAKRLRMEEKVWRHLVVVKKEEKVKKVAAVKKTTKKVEKKVVKKAPVKKAIKVASTTIKNQSKKEASKKEKK